MGFLQREWGVVVGVAPEWLLGLEGGRDCFGGLLIPSSSSSLSTITTRLLASGCLLETDGGVADGGA